MSELSLAAVAAAESARQALPEFCSHLSNASGLRITPRMMSSYSELTDQCVRGLVDLVWAPPLVAIALENDNAATALVAVTRTTRSAYHSALFCLSLQPFRRPEDLRGASVAWVSKESASGYFVPRWHLRSLGLSLDRCFDREIFCESHEAVARAVLEGKADVGATHVALEPVTGQLARAPWQALGARPSSIRVLLLIGPIPGDVIAAARHVPLSSCRSLTAALLSMRQDEGARLFDATRFEPVPEGHLRRLLGLRARPDG